jgi:1-acyl-sn-glycerol-3-phosphate acyltransferase
MKYLRSAAFTVAFPVWTGICCIFLAFGPFLPRRGALVMALIWVRSVAWVERHILGLHYRVIGAENCPSHGAFIVAAKHQSTFETMKLHLILNDPAIVLKKELLRIPIWGRYLKQTGMIPIDRGAGRNAVDTMLSASLAAKAEGRPIVIFPQGTRVPAGEHRRYKPGVVALYKDLGLPIVPLALNSGVFWPKKGLKHGGTVTFSFLPPIEPGLEQDAALAVLEKALEAETNRLVAAELQDRNHS